MLSQLLDAPFGTIWKSVSHHQMFIGSPVVLPNSSLEQNEGALHTNVLHSLLAQHSKCISVSESGLFPRSLLKGVTLIS